MKKYNKELGNIKTENEDSLKFKNNRGEGPSAYYVKHINFLKSIVINGYVDIKLKNKHTYITIICDSDKFNKYDKKDNTGMTGLLKTMQVKNYKIYRLFGWNLIKLIFDKELSNNNIRITLEDLKNNMVIDIEKFPKNIDSMLRDNTFALLWEITCNSYMHNSKFDREYEKQFMVNSNGLTRDDFINKVKEANWIFDNVEDYNILHEAMKEIGLTHYAVKLGEHKYKEFFIKGDKVNAI